ncbi:MAG: alpha-L-fucosidase, partial [Draconibacterium sp.]|nr:alpha-L-fucosidase [Draconibacterium sp.]
AKEILFVAKHTGGFCWWQTQTTSYGIKDTPYKNGNGDVLKELSVSCKKFGLNLGIYVYPGDENWGAGIGSGGLTSDPSKQAAYNKVYRKQLTEVLTNYGNMLEVWFDGSCKIEVSDILEKYAGNSVILQGPKANLRWPGTETGKLFYPAWNTVSKADLNTGVSTQLHGDPDGDAWAPLEADTPLYNHFWFWAQYKESKRKTLDELMECYYKSAGYGGVLLLNSTPDTTGLIPADDVKLYKAFGDEINHRFKTPIAELSKKAGNMVTLDFHSKQKINHIITMEDYRQGQRIRSYKIEGLVDGNWQELCSGQSIGRKKIDYFPEVEVSKIRLNVDKHVGTPLVRKLSAYYVDGFIAPPKNPISPYSEWAKIASWEQSKWSDGQLKLAIDLSKKIKLPGQYTVKLVPENKETKIEIISAEIHYEGRKALDEFVTIKGSEISINRTAMVTDESTSVLYITIKCNEKCAGKVNFRPALIY